MQCIGMYNKYLKLRELWHLFLNIYNLIRHNYAFWCANRVS